MFKKNVFSKGLINGEEFDEDMDEGSGDKGNDDNRVYSTYLKINYQSIRSMVLEKADLKNYKNTKQGSRGRRKDSLK